MGDYQNLELFRKSYTLSMRIFQLSRSFPKEEKYSLTDQILRSSRAVCANFGEAYQKRRYPKHFLSKLCDCDSENTETGIWIRFAFDCGYIDNETFQALHNQCFEIGKLIGYMIANPGKFQ